MLHKRTLPNCWQIRKKGRKSRVFVINPSTPNAVRRFLFNPPDAVKAADTALKFDLLTALSTS